MHPTFLFVLPVRYTVFKIKGCIQMVKWCYNINRAIIMARIITNLIEQVNIYQIRSTKLKTWLLDPCARNLSFSNNNIKTNYPASRNKLSIFRTFSTLTFSFISILSVARTEPGEKSVCPRSAEDRILYKGSTEDILL